MARDIYLDFKGAVIHGENTVGGIVNQVSQMPDVDPSILKELHQVSLQLAEMDSLLSETVKDLEEALRKGDRPNAVKFFTRIITGTASQIFIKAVSQPVLNFLNRMIE